MRIVTAMAANATGGPDRSPAREAGDVAEAQGHRETDPMELSMRRPFHHRDFAAADLVDRKGAVTISVCVPAKNEAATIGGIVEAIRTPLVLEHPLVDEIVVVDDRSTDGTGALAAAAGASVVSTCAPLADVVPGTGKGEALWRSLAASTGDLVVFCDADITDFDTRFVLGLVGPLLVDPTVQFVKGFYERPDTHAPGTGGRTTELVARPLVSLLFPSLTGVVQPLSGEYAARRRVLEQVPFVQGYGVDLGLLIDVQARWGAGAIAQVDLVSRHHRNRSLDELSPQALSIMQTAFARAGLPTGAGATLRRPGLPPLACTHVERPPLVELRQAAGGQASA
jgi:glucosyl-3-phosphoglycerate synthase